eukprot:SAG31_NODE_623_length_13492_cov_62.118196_11_plen_118_part_00
MVLLGGVVFQFCDRTNIHTHEVVLEVLEQASTRFLAQLVRQRASTVVDLELEFGEANVLRHRDDVPRPKIDRLFGFERDHITAIVALAYLRKISIYIVVDNQAVRSSLHGACDARLR